MGNPTVEVARVAGLERQDVLAECERDPAFEAQDALLAVMVVTLVTGRHARRELRDQQLEVPLGARRQDLDARGVAAQVEALTLPGAHHERDRLLLDHQIGDRRFERPGEVLEGREGRRGMVVFDLTDEALGESACLGELLHGHSAPQSQIPYLLTKLLRAGW